MGKAQINLTGVPETMLWPLYNRGCEQKRNDRMLEDPMSLELMESIDYDYRENFGKFNAGHPMRSRVFDDAVKEWLVSNPEGTVISVGEGIDTQFWRVDNGKLSWVSVDLPEAIEIRNILLPKHERIKTIACSAIDFDWMNEIPAEKPVFIVMAGVIMYFREEEGKDLLTEIAEYFKDAEIVLDMIPEWYSKKTIKGMYVTKNYKAPPMPWGLNFCKSEDLIKVHSSLKIKQQLSFADRFPKRMRPYSYFRNIKWVRNNFAPWMVQLSVN